MQVKELKLGNIKLKNNVFLAPIAGYTDYAFRHLVLPLGYSLCFTELTSAKGIVYGGKGNDELLFCKGDEDCTAAQIFGSDGYYMRKAIESKELEGYKIIDINMGCPVPKIFKNGEGSALLLDIKKAENVIKECVKTGKIITVKIRTGQKAGDNIATEFTKMAEGAGASLVTIHGRVREAYYSGEVDYDAILKAKQSVNIPVIANGGVFTEEDADNLIDRTGADGIMLARGGIANPFLVATLTDTPCDYNLKKLMIDHLTLRRDRIGDKRTAIEFRKFIPYYLKGQRGVKDFKMTVNTLEAVDDIIELIEKTF